MLFGGYVGGGCGGCPGPVVANLWTWHAGAWTQLNAHGPSARDGAVMAFLDKRMVLFGGYGADTEMLSGATLMSDTWTFDGATWTRDDVPGPSARFAPTMASLGNTLVLFGGASGTEQYLADTWTWDGSDSQALAVWGRPDETAGRWSRRQPGAPVRRAGATMAAQ